MDAFSSYNQIKLEESDQEKTSFVTSQGFFLLQGHAFWIEECGGNIPKARKQDVVRQIRCTIEVYLNDMLIKSREKDHHLSDLRETFETLCLYRMKLNPSKCVFGVSSRKFLGFMVSQRGVKANPDKIQAILEISPLKNVKEVQSLNGRVATLNKFVSQATNKCLPFFRILKKLSNGPMNVRGHSRS